MSKKNKPGDIGGYWLSRRPNSSAWCCTWFDPATRQTRRASLGTDDIEQAKIALASWVVAHGQITDERPSEVFFESVLVRYYEHQARHLTWIMHVDWRV